MRMHVRARVGAFHIVHPRVPVDAHTSACAHVHEHAVDRLRMPVNIGLMMGRIVHTHARTHDYDHYQDIEHTHAHAHAHAHARTRTRTGTMSSGSRSAATAAAATAPAPATAQPWAYDTSIRAHAGARAWMPSHGIYRAAHVSISERTSAQCNRKREHNRKGMRTTMRMRMRMRTHMHTHTHEHRHDVIRI
jgi:hypothetical protein